MNDLYAIDPKAPSSLRDLADLMRIFSPDHGRFIADFPIGWGRLLFQHMDEIADLESMAAVEAWVGLANGSLLPQREIFNSRLSWEENALKLIDKARLLIGPSGAPETFVKPLNKVLMDPSAFPDASAGHIPRTVSAYIDAIRPLVLTSPKIVLVDPYFSLKYIDKNSGTLKNDRRREFIKSLFSEFLKFKRVHCFEIYTRIDRASNPSTIIELYDLVSIAEEVGYDSSSISLKPLRSDVSFDRHGRYCLGLNRGLHFDWGFDIANDGSTNLVQWMPKSVLTPLLNRFT